VARTEADRLNGLKYVALDLTLGHELAPGMARYLHDHGVTANELTFFRERRAPGQRWLGLDYYPTCEHRVSASGRLTTNNQPLGFVRLATDYYRRYGLPLFHCETNRTAGLAPAWLASQWNDVLTLRRAGIPVTGFTWYSLTDQIDWQHCLRVERNEVHPVGLFDLARRERPVGAAYRALIARWSGMLAGSEEEAPAAAMA